MSVMTVIFPTLIGVIMSLALCSSQGEQLVLPLGETTAVLCTAPAENNYIINWIVNETTLMLESPNMLFYLGAETMLLNRTKGRNVTFSAIQNVNNTHLRCVVTDSVNPSNSFISLNLTIIIGGYPLAPNVMYSMNNNMSILLFSWSAPFSHNISDREPDILYYIVNITTTDLDDNLMKTVNTTDTVYLLQPETCLFAVYQVEIAAVNIIGVGEKYISPPLSLHELSLTGADITFNDDLPVINIQISTNCLKEIDNVYQVEFIPTFSRQVFNISTSSMEQNSITLSSADIQLNEHYEAIVRVKGAPALHHHFSLSTFDVQNVQVTSNNDLHDIRCDFAQGSKVNGCKIILKPMSHAGGNEIVGGGCEFTAVRAEGSREALVQVMIPSGNYSMMVYDDEDVVPENPAYNSTITSSPFVQGSNTGCVVISDENDSPTDAGESDITRTTTVVVVVTVITIILVVVAILMLTLVVYVKYHEGQKKARRKTECNDYIDTESFQRPPIVAQSSHSSDSTDSGDTPTSSTPLALHESHYTEVQVGKRNMPSLRPPVSDERVTYSTVQIPTPNPPPSDPQLEQNTDTDPQ